MRYRNDAVSPKCRQKVEAAFQELLTNGRTFYLDDLMRGAACSRSTVNAVLSPVLSKIYDELEFSALGTLEEVASWRRRFVTLRAFINSSRRADRLIERWILTHVDEIASKGEQVTSTKIRALCGGNARRITRILHDWGKRTGLYKPARAKFTHGDGKKIILAAYEKRRQSGVPFTHDDLAKECGCSSSLVSSYAKHVTAKIAVRLLNAAVQDEGAYRAWAREYRTLRAMLNNSPSRDDLIAKSARLHVEQLHREGKIPTYSALIELGCSQRHARSSLEDWSKRTGIPLEFEKVWKDVALEDVLRRVDPVLHSIPLTFLEDPQHGAPFNEAQRRMLYRLRCPSLRNVAFFVMTFADKNRRNDISFFTQLDAMMCEGGIEGYLDIDVDSFYEDYHSRKTFAGHSDGKRSRFIQTLLRLVRLQKDYLRKLTPQQQEPLKPYLLRMPSDIYFWRESQLAKSDQESREARRKEDVAVVHEQFYLLREVAERRVGLVLRLREAYLRAIKTVEEGASTPLDFAIEDEVLEVGRKPQKARFHLTLWRANDLKALHEQHGGAPYYEKREVSYLPDHPSRQNGYYLTYTRGADAPPSDRYWFSDIVYDARDSTPSRESGESFRKADYRRIPRPPVSQAVLAWVGVLEKTIPNLEVVPVHFCVHATLMGDAAVQVLTKTGARAHEFLQLRLEKEHLQKITVKSGHDVVAFHAMPKGATAEAPYFMDERCMKSLHRWWSFQQEIGYVFSRVPAAASLGKKLPAATYLWQQNGRHMDVSAVNGVLEFVLSGTPLIKADGSRVRLTSHLLRHTFATEMRSLDVPIDVLALLMKQKDTSVTAYYSKPTPLMLAEYQRRIFEVRSDLTRTHRRSAKQIRIQLEDAITKVGALAPVVGGTCTVAGSCPAQFACLGCFGNVPDPSKRDQVAEYRAHYAERAASAQEAGLTHELRKAQQHVANCDDMLAEMESILAAENAASRSLEMYISSQGGGD